MLYFNEEREHFFKEYQNPGIPESGIAADDLEKDIQLFLADKKFPTPLAEHVAAFSRLLEKSRIGVSQEDLFVNLGFRGTKVIEKLLGMPRRQCVAENMKKTTAAWREEFNNAGFGYFFWDFAHSVPDWNHLLQKGFPGILQEVEEKEKSFIEKHQGTITPQEKDFFLAVKTEYRQILLLLDRIIFWAQKSSCQKPTIEALQSLRKGAPNSFYEAMLLIWLFHQLSEYGDCIQTRSFGNLDLMLYPYYKKDLESGKFTQEDIRQIVRNFYAQVSGMKYFFGHPFYLGGTLPDGSSGFNELTTLLLEEYGNMGIYDPKIQIKLSPNTPAKYTDQALELIRSGNNSIVFTGEPAMLKSMLRNGYSAEEARCAVIKGCYEYCAPGAVETAPVVLNMPQIFWAQLQANSQAATYEEFVSACLQGFKTVIDKAMGVADEFEKYLDFVNPAPLFSGASDTALEAGADGYGKSAKYNNSNVWFSGPITVADSLNAIKKYVYEEQKLTLPQFLEILEKNWKGSENLQGQIRLDPDHFGNNMPSDAEGIRFLENLAEYINGRPNSRGGFYTTAVHSADWFIKFGKRVKATPDGRSEGEELTKNISPRQGGSRKGVTALLASVLKFDTSLFMAGFPVDVMLHPSAVAGNEGLLAMRALLMTYIKNHGHAMHFNIFSTQMLKEAQLHPERYTDLQVRVCGWNVLWNDLSAAEQAKYLEQAEANELNF